ncbi:MAG: IS5/IS1182 family transposase, partial [Parachlamydiaceae bacterium]
SKEGRSLWGKLTGYNQRVLVEAAISRLKRLFGDRFYSKSLERQMVENRLRCLLINRMCHG